MTQRNYILDKEVAEKKLKRMAYEIVERNTDEEEIVLAGIRESGTVIARRIQQLLKEISNLKTQLVSLTLDKKRPESVEISEKISFENKVVIVIDDVMNSGKTLLYAMKPFLQTFPVKIQTLVLVERTHANFPIRPDFVGLSVSTTLQDHIYVETKKDEIIGAYLS